MNRKEAIINALKDLCIRPNLKGYWYLLYAVEKCMEDYKLLQSVTKKLYPAVADKYDSNAIQVEKAMRHAITKSHSLSDKEVWLKYFGKVNKVTTSEFIGTLAVLLPYENI